MFICHVLENTHMSEFFPGKKTGDFMDEKILTAHHLIENILQSNHMFFFKWKLRKAQKSSFPHPPSPSLNVKSTH